MPRPRLSDGAKRTVRINVTLTPAEETLVKSGALGAESLSQTARRLMLNGASYAQSSLAILRPSPRPYPCPSTPEPDA